MNLEHFRAFIWLRWRIRVNQLKRGGIANQIILLVISVSIVTLSISMFFLAAGLGATAMKGVTPGVVMYVWDGILVALLFSWMIGLLTELQRSESLSLDKFLHLPVSLSSAFFINYLSSLLSFTLIAFVPGILGFCFGLIISQGVAMVLMFPLALSFLFALTALTYQFQGWLATLMSNPRRRRTIVVGITMSMVLVFQLPNLLNIANVKRISKASKVQIPPPDLLAKTQAENRLISDMQANKITKDEFERKQLELNQKFDAEMKEYNEKVANSRKTWNQETKEQVEQYARIANTVLPPGWVALGASSLAEQNVLPALLGTFAFVGVGYASLRRAYRSTMRYYTGIIGEKQSNIGEAKAVTVVKSKPTGPPKTLFCERQLPFVSEQASAIACVGLQSLIRAPEVKMLLMAPIIMVVVFGSIFFINAPEVPVAYRPFIPTIVLMMILLTIAQIVANQFGNDRSGFRSFVLAPASRRDVLIGKNLAVAPFVLGIGLLAITGVQIFLPMRIDHYLATLLQMVSVFLLYCPLANLLSIYAPIAMPAGAVKAQNVKFLTMIIHMVAMFVVPLLIMPTLIPLGLETLLTQLNVVNFLPIALVGSIGVLALAVWVYSKLMTWQGDLLTKRELAILQVVVSKAE